MSTTMYYFSTTGNTMQVARQLAAELGDTQLLAIRNLRTGAVKASSARVGILFPIYCWGLPRIVSQFVKRLEVPSGAYVFSVCTMGGTVGGALVQMRSRLAERGIKLAAGWTVQMPNNYPPVGGGWSEDRQKRAFGKAHDRLARIAVAVKAGTRSGVERWPAPLCWLTDAAYAGAMSHFQQADKRFTVSQACNHCGICAKVCPVGNIEMVAGAPQWRHNCEQCMACLQWCPTEAINWTRISAGRKRYHHPDVKARDMWT
jgi:ferredoxin/flavodoxin